MKKETLENLVKKFFEDTLSAEEAQTLHSWYAEESNTKVEWSSGNADEENRLSRHLFNGIATKAGIKAIPAPVSFFKKFSVAASIIFALGLLTIYFIYKNRPDDTVTLVLKNDIRPGRINATLTLGNGRKIKLDDARVGELANDAGVSINKNPDGTVVYHITENPDGNDEATNILSTGRGETYSVVLPDGTRIRLNDASSLTYPASFAKKEKREVKLEGEAYFEVSKDPAHPFLVNANGQSLQVLGTHFNLKAYRDESTISTTLLEGSVRITRNGHSMLLKPGEQSIAERDKLSLVASANIRVATAWTKDVFAFDNDDLRSVMRQIGRWYNVEVVYQGKIPEIVFSGNIHRNASLDQVLEILRYTKVNFRISGKKIILTP